MRSCFFHKKRVQWKKGIFILVKIEKITYGASTYEQKNRIENVRHFSFFDACHHGEGESHESGGGPVVSFGVGEPDFNTPKNIIDAAKAGSRQGLYEIHPLLGTSAFEEGDLRKI